MPHSALKYTKVRTDLKKYKVILFDLDGTLTDPARGLVEGFVYALKKMGVDYGERSALRRFIGPPLYDEWKNTYGFTDEETVRAIDVFREYYDIYGWWDNDPYEGIHDALSSLKEKGKILAVATSKPENTARRVVKLFGLDKYFDYVGGALSGSDRDKKSDVIKYVLDSLGSPDLSDCVMIGDRKYDAIGAEEAGLDSIGVLWGHGDIEELSSHGFKRLLKSVSELAEL